MLIIRFATAILTVGFIVVCWWQVLSAGAGLTSPSFVRDGIPLRYLVVDGVAQVPGIVIAHGFAGSRQLMLGYGYVLAKAGYAVILLDFDGHGANSRPLLREGATLPDNLAVAYAGLIDQPEVNRERIALLGHSMGSGVLAQLVWLPWLLIPERLLRWPLLAAAVLPWLLATGMAQHGETAVRRVLWWLFQSVTVIVGLGLVVLLTPELFFVLLLIPVIPLVLGVMTIAGGIVRRPWSFAIGSSLFFGWLVAAVFPLV